MTSVPKDWTRFLPSIVRSKGRRFNSSGPETRPPFASSRPSRPVQAPNPDWKLGSGLASDSVGAKEWKDDEKGGWKTFEMDKMEPGDAYRLLTSAIVPRPIAFVSTLSSDGVANLAPMSYFSMISHNPPVCTVAFTQPQRRQKDTRENILATKEFVVNVISEPFIEAANSCAVEAPADVDEWIFSGLTPKPSLLVKPARVQESAVSLECELYHHHDIPTPNTQHIGTTLVLGLIKHAHVRNAVLNEDGLTIDVAKLRPVARFGGTTYARVGDSFDMDRPSWKASKAVYEELVQRREDSNEPV